MQRPWVIDTSRIEEWMATLSSGERTRMVALISLLSDYGPQLGRPYVGKIVGSKHSAMKELRVSGEQGRVLRVLFCFAPNRTAVCLRAGDKSGNWSGWYSREIALADDEFDRYVRSIS